MVTKVGVEIVDKDGKVLEQGEARQVEPEWWEYGPNAGGTIEATAWDLAGNRTKAVL
jgi:hypothetical protein